MIEVGQYAFPFEIELPDWLPATSALADNEHSVLMQVKYQLIAQVEGEVNHLYMQPLSMGISKFRFERAINIHRREARVPLYGLRNSLKVDVGGFIGLASTTCTSSITLDKD